MTRTRPEQISHPLAGVILDQAELDDSPLQLAQSLHASERLYVGFGEGDKLIRPTFFIR